MGGAIGRAPLAQQLDASIFMPLDVSQPGQLEAVFERIAQDWGRLDFLVHSIAFSTRDALGGRVTDCPRAGFATTMILFVISLTGIRHGASPFIYFNF